MESTNNNNITNDINYKNNNTDDKTATQAENENLNNDKYNNTENNTFVKTQVKWKISEKTDPQILSKFKSKFDNAEEFLKLDDDVIFGKKIDHNEKFRNKENIKPYQIIGDLENIFPPIAKNANTTLNVSNTMRNRYSKKFTFSESFNNCNNTLNTNSLLAQKSNYENYIKRYSKLRSPLYANIVNLITSNKQKDNLVLLTEEQVDKLFEEKNNKTIENYKDSKKLNDEILKRVDPQCAWEMQDLLSKQEKALLLKEENERKVNNLAKFIAKKSLKNEAELLMNKTDGFRLKTQCIQRIQSSNPVKIFNYGVENDWMLNLRKNDSHCVPNTNKNADFYFSKKEKKSSGSSKTNFNFLEYNSEVGRDTNNFSKFNKNYKNNNIKDYKGMKNNNDNNNNNNINGNGAAYDQKAIIKRNLLTRSKSKKDLKIKTQLDIRVTNNDDLGAVVLEHNKVEIIENIVKPNSASINDFRKYASNRTISSRLRTIKVTCEEMINANNLNINGNNLLTFEKDLAKTLQGKKFMLKENEDKSNATLKEIELNSHYNRLEFLKNKF